MFMHDSRTLSDLRTSQENFTLRKGERVVSPLENFFPSRISRSHEIKLSEQSIWQAFRSMYMFCLNMQGYQIDVFPPTSNGGAQPLHNVQPSEWQYAPLPLPDANNILDSWKKWQDNYDRNNTASTQANAIAEAARIETRVPPADWSQLTLIPIFNSLGAEHVEAALLALSMSLNSVLQNSPNDGNAVSFLKRSGRIVAGLLIAPIVALQVLSVPIRIVTSVLGSLAHILDEVFTNKNVSMTSTLAAAADPWKSLWHKVCTIGSMLKSSLFSFVHAFIPTSKERAHTGTSQSTPRLGTVVPELVSSQQANAHDDGMGKPENGRSALAVMGLFSVLPDGRTTADERTPLTTPPLTCGR